MRLMTRRALSIIGCHIIQEAGIRIAFHDVATQTLNPKLQNLNALDDVASNSH